MESEALYDRGFIVTYKEGDSSLFRTNIPLSPNMGNKYHTITDGESLYDIARKYYGASSLWFLIADVNDSIEDIFDLPVSEIILIPTIMVS